MEVKTRGKVAPDKEQTNWRMPIRVLRKLDLEAPKYGFSSKPSFAAFLLDRVLFDEKLLARIFGER